MGRLLKRLGGISVAKTAVDTLALAFTEGYHLSGVKKAVSDALSLSLGEKYSLRGVKKEATDALSLETRENVSISAEGGVGGNSPPIGSSGFSGNTATASTVIMDLRQNFASSGILWTGSGNGTMSRAPTYTYRPGDGYYGQGCGRFIPGYYHSDPGDPLGQHYCGIGQLLGMDTVSTDPTRFCMGQLMRVGSQLVSQQGGLKDVILFRSIGMRPMIIPKVGSQTTVWGACDGTVCNTHNDPSDPDWHNDRNNQPNFKLVEDKWVWMELQVNTNSPGSIRVKLWDEDGIFQGATVSQGMSTSGGTITGLDIINFWNSVPSPGPNCYKDIEYVEFRLGSDVDMTPPIGFPGSARG